MDQNENYYIKYLKKPIKLNREIRIICHIDNLDDARLSL